MKILRIFILFSIIIAISINKIAAQKVYGTQPAGQWYTPDIVPCLTETISGSYTEYYVWTNKTYHVNQDAVLIGETTGEEYTIHYLFNYNASEDGDCHFVFPIFIKHDGKTIAIIHQHLDIVYDGQGWLVRDRWVSDVNCTGSSSAENK